MPLLSVQVRFVYFPFHCSRGSQSRFPLSHKPSLPLFPSPWTLAKAFIVSAHIFLFLYTSHAYLFSPSPSFISISLFFSHFTPPLPLSFSWPRSGSTAYPHHSSSTHSFLSDRAQLGTLEASSSTLLLPHHSTTTTQGEAHTLINNFHKKTTNNIRQLSWCRGPALLTVLGSVSLTGNHTSTFLSYRASILLLTHTPTAMTTTAKLTFCTSLISPTSTQSNTLLFFSYLIFLQHPIRSIVSYN